jgi:hypothetical protein
VLRNSNLSSRSVLRMPNQQDLESHKVYTIVEVEEEQGQKRTKNDPVDEKQRENWTNRDDGVFTLDLSLNACIHGHMTPEGAPATLIICDFEIHSTDSRYQVKEMDANFTFNAVNEGPVGPNVVAWAPYVRRRHNATPVGVEKKQGTSAGLGVASHGVAANFGWNSEEKKTYDITVFDSIESRPNWVTKESRISEIKFTFKRRDTTKELGNMFRVAFLLDRQNNGPFMCEFEVALRGGFWADAKRKSRDFFGEVVIEADDPVIFDPSLERWQRGSIAVEVKDDEMAKLHNGRWLAQALGGEVDIDAISGMGAANTSTAEEIKTKTEEEKNIAGRPSDEEEGSKEERRALEKDENEPTNQTG